MWDTSVTKKGWTHLTNANTPHALPHKSYVVLHDYIYEVSMNKLYSSPSLVLTITLSCHHSPPSHTPIIDIHAVQGTSSLSCTSYASHLQYFEDSSTTTTKRQHGQTEDHSCNNWPQLWWSPTHGTRPTTSAHYKDNRCTHTPVNCHLQLSFDSWIWVTYCTINSSEAGGFYCWLYGISTHQMATIYPSIRLQRAALTLMWTHIWGSNVHDGGWLNDSAFLFQTWLWINSRSICLARAVGWAGIFWYLKPEMRLLKLSQQHPVGTAFYSWLQLTSGFWAKLADHYSRIIFHQ